MSIVAGKHLLRLKLSELPFVAPTNHNFHASPCDFQFWVSHAAQTISIDGREGAFTSASERRSVKHHFRLNTGLSASSNEAAISTLLMQCPLRPIRMPRADRRETANFLVLQ